MKFPILIASVATCALAAASGALAAPLVTLQAVSPSAYPGYDAKYAVDKGPGSATTDWAAHSTGVGSYLDVAIGGNVGVTTATVTDRVTSGGGNGGFVGGLYDYTTSFSITPISALGGVAVGASQVFSFSAPASPGSPADFAHAVSLSTPIESGFLRYQVLAANGANPGLSNISLQGVTLSNLLANPDFSAGNTGFSSGYAYVAVAGPMALYAPGTYGIGSSPSDYHDQWSAFGDHTTGDGAMLILNGAESGASFWSQVVPVAKNRAYDFTGWLASSYAASPANVQLTINGQPVGGLGAAATPGVWSRFSTSWYSGEAATATLRLTDLNPAFSGNDFALDDLRFSAAVPEPAAWTLMLVGFGLTGAAVRRRRAAIMA